MAREVLRAWDELLGTGPGLSVEIEGYSRTLATEEQPSVTVVVRNPDDRPLTADLEVGPSLFAATRSVELPARGEARVEVPLSLPRLEPPGRTGTWRIRALARSAEGQTSGLDVKWMALAPVVMPNVVEGKLLPDQLTWHAFGANSLVKGDRPWKGDDDLSARFSVALQGERLVFVVEVTDDDLDVARAGKHIADGDSVEAVLDLRGPQDQAKPVFSEDVVLLLVRPATTPRDEAYWEPLDGMTPRLVGVAAESELTERGYVVRVSLPRDALARGAERSLSGLGFDVHVNDSDFGGGRERQMVWAGTQWNFVNPSALAGLVDPGSPPTLGRLSLR